MTHNTDANTNTTARPIGCPVCQELDLEEAVARTERDLSKVTDCRVLRARHLAAENGEQS